MFGPISASADAQTGRFPAVFFLALLRSFLTGANTGSVGPTKKPVPSSVMGRAAPPYGGIPTMRDRPWGWQVVVGQDLAAHAAVTPRCTPPRYLLAVV
jgi:hypothetical protein